MLEIIKKKKKKSSTHNASGGLFPTFERAQSQRGKRGGKKESIEATDFPFQREIERSHSVNRSFELAEGE